jgi:glutaredoxin
MLKINKKIIFIFLFIFFSLTQIVNAGDFQVNAYFFYGDSCPHCAKERIYLESVAYKYTNLKIYDFEIYHNSDNIKILKEVAQTITADISGVPFLVIGDEYFSGYSEGITSKKIEDQILKCSNSYCPDSLAKIIGLNIVIKPIDINTESTSTESFNKENLISVPFLGSIDINNFSLPVLTIVMGILDGFNPCAMWTLLFLISLLLGMKDRKRMWILGSAFIIASASVYFIFMSAWLNLILFLGFIVWVRVIIGILALLGGSYSLKEGFSENSGCKVTNNEKRQRVFEKMKSLINQNSFLISLGGIIVLAFLVNLVELICSAGLPAIYTQVLALNELSTWQYYLYILIYILFFMVDDLFVFFVAMITLEMTGITTRYAKYSRLIGGIIMLMIGLLLIFKPEWLMFK